jgi:hypothetical protein
MDRVSHPLDGCRAKLQRGGQHFRALHQEFTAYWKRAPYRIVEDRDSQPGYIVQKLQILEAPPVHWSPMIGDVVHNLRCALDYLTCELVLLDGGTVTKSTQFPILDRPQPTGIERWTKGMTAAHRALIEAEQPYHGRYGGAAEDPLALLRELSNTDKHRALHLVYYCVGGTKFSLAVPGPVEHAWVNLGPLEDGAGVQAFRLTCHPTAECDVKVQAELTFDIALGETGPGPGRPVAHSLAAIGAHVRQFVERFAPEFP